MEVITTHLNADFDAMASMVAAKKLYPNAIAVFPGSQERNLRNFFVESMVYDLGLSKLKSVPMEQVTRLILVDTRQRTRIGPFEEIVDREGLSIHIYDHHPPTKWDVHGEVEVIKEVGSTTTILTRMIIERGLELTSDEATILALGIYEDTGSFTFTSTTEEDYYAAGFLRKKGANLGLVQDMLTHELTVEQVTLLNDMVQSAETHVINGVEVMVTKVASEEYVGDFAVLVHKLVDMENVPAVFALAQMEDRVYIVGRSRIPEVNAADVLIPLGGGGHSTAASASVKELPLNQAEQKLLRNLKSKVNASRTARDIMSYPVVSARPDQTLASAAETLVRYSINVLPIMENGAVLGLVTRQVVEKAAYHGLKDLPVSEYMTSDFSTVFPDAGISEIQEKIVAENQRMLPVVEEGKLVGVITRTDLLNTLMDTPLTGQQLYDGRQGKEFTRKKNLTSLMKERLNREIVELLKSLGRIADGAGVSVYAVGGFVRDLLLRRQNLDIDVVVEGDGIAFAQKFAQERGNVRVRTHKKFGTAVILFPDGFSVDVATARREVYISPAALPIVESSSIKLDLYRRDFTINTLALQLNNRYFGTLIDFFGAQKDIRERTIRVLHNLSFVEDPTRVFRAIRFEKRFGFRIGKLTRQLIDNARRIDVFKGLSGRRLFHELELMLSEEHPVLSIARMNDFKLLSVLHPALKFDGKLEDLFFRVDVVLNWFELLYLDERYSKWKTYLPALGDQLTGAEFETLLKRFEISKAIVGELVKAKQDVELLSKRVPPRKELLPGEIHELLHGVSVECLLFLMAKTAKENLRKAISTYFTTVRRVHTILRGRDLREMGYPPGRHYGKILNTLFMAKLNEEVGTREEEMTFVRERFPLCDFTQGRLGVARPPHR